MSSKVVIKVEQLSKQYRLGSIGGATVREELSRWWARKRNKPDPYTKVGQVDDSSESSFWALRDVSFEVREGEVLGIIGRNGAGKSTLLKILSRITTPTRGKATIRGRVGSLLEVGTGFHPELTGRENVFLNGAILGMTRLEIARKLDEIIEFAEMAKFIDTPVKRYSSGMTVRLAFAVAAHLEPEILIVDEVLAVGDLSFQKKCLGKMKDVAGHGRTVLFVSHNMLAVRNLCRSALLLHGGRVIQVGAVDSVMNTYLSNGARFGATWRRRESSHEKLLAFVNASLRLEGDQPALRLRVKVQLESGGTHSSAFLAIDISDATGTPLMQALPSTERYVCVPPHQKGSYCIEIKLPPLVPGSYTLSLWVGPNWSVTYDQVTSAMTFEVRESPTVGRLFQHTPDHGWIVPESELIVEDSLMNPVESPSSQFKV